MEGERLEQEGATKSRKTADAEEQVGDRAAVAATGAGAKLMNPSGAPAETAAPPHKALANPIAHEGHDLAPVSEEPHSIAEIKGEVAHTVHDTEPVKVDVVMTQKSIVQILLIDIRTFISFRSVEARADGPRIDHSQRSGLW